MMMLLIWWWWWNSYDSDDAHDDHNDDDHDECDECSDDNALPYIMPAVIWRMDTEIQLTCQFIADNQFQWNAILGLKIPDTFGVRAVFNSEGDGKTELTNTARAA